MPVQLASLLQGRYRIDAALSEHAHGGVYRSYDLETDSPCVVKEFLSIGQDEFTAWARELLPRIHPNLAGVLDYFSLDESHHYLVMEYVRGESLAEQVVRLGALSEHQALARVSQVLVALDYLHTRTTALLHCDVNPSNIFITRDDLTVLVGYGIGGRLSPSTTATLVAPEHVAGNPEVASDVYAVGATLYFALTGKIPGRKDGGWTDRFAIEPLQGLNPRLSLEFSRIIEKSMHYRADGRYNSIREFRKALGRGAARAGIAADAPLESHLEVSEGQPSPHHAWKLPALTAAVVVGIVGIGILLYSYWDMLLISPTQLPPTVVVVAGIVEPSSTVRPPSPSAAPSATVTLTLTPTHTSWPSAVAQAAPSSTLKPTSTLPPSATSRPLTDTPRPTATLGIGSTMLAGSDRAVLVYVPQGKFVVGSTWSDPLAMDDEQPQQIVYLPAFWIDRTEVTNFQYGKCVTAGMCTEPRPTSSATRMRYFGNDTYDEYPVLWVDWSQASAYCGWAGRRLPTDVEWEKAARGTDGRRYPWGDEPANSLTITGEARANFGSLMRDTTRVGMYPAGASPYGALDMSWNVAEWVGDFYRSHYYQYVQWLTATLEAEWRFRGGQHGVRNGSWNGSLINVRAAYRGFSARDDYSAHNLGFRCAATPKP